MTNPASIKLLEILCGTGGDASTLGRAGVTRLEMNADGGLTLTIGTCTFPADQTVVAPVASELEVEASAAESPETGEEQGGEDDLDTAHLDP